MTKATDLTPSIIAGRVFMAVGPVRIAAFIMLSAALSDHHDAALPDSVLENAQRRIQTARAMLEHEMASLLSSAALTATDRVEEAQKDALAAVRALDDCAKAVKVDVENCAFQALRDSALNVEQTVTVFLDDFQKFAHAQDAEALKTGRDAIRTAVGEIHNISTSINLISINASIEAARAGAAGRGFAVIANEIQSLSAQTEQSLNKIWSRVGEN